jgi:hypothetical protein
LILKAIPCIKIQKNKAPLCGALFFWILEEGGSLAMILMFSFVARMFIKIGESLGGLGLLID